MPAPGAYPPPGNPEGIAGHLLRVLPLPYGANIPFQVGHMINNHIRANQYREFRNNALSGGMPGRTAAPTGLHLNEDGGNDQSYGGPHSDNYGIDPFGESGGYDPGYSDNNPSPNGLPGSESNPPADTTTDPYQGWPDLSNQDPQVEINPSSQGYTDATDDPYQGWLDQLHTYDTGGNNDTQVADNSPEAPPDYIGTGGPSDMHTYNDAPYSPYGPNHNFTGFDANTLGGSELGGDRGNMQRGFGEATTDEGRTVFGSGANHHGQIIDDVLTSILGGSNGPMRYQGPQLTRQQLNDQIIASLRGH